MAETKKYYHNIDADNNKIINPLLNPLTTAQRTTVGGLLGPLDEGYVCFDTTLNQQYFWDGTVWVTVTASAAWGSITGTLTAQTDLTAYLAANYYPLSSNPAGYLTTAAANLLYYPLSSNPANYIDLTDLSASTGISYNNLTGVITNSAPDQVVVLSNGTGISTSGTYPNFTITNTSPDQTVVLNNGTGISISGTYPNFTITNTSPSSGGTLTAVTATSPLFSTGGTTPDISIQQASGSQAGYLSSTDWTTFNTKVGGSGTLNYVSKWSSSSALTDSQIFDNGTTVGIGTATPSGGILDVVGISKFSSNTNGAFDNVISIENSGTGTYRYAVLGIGTLYSDPSGTNLADIRLSNSNTTGIRIYASNSELTNIPSGAGFQFFSNADPTYTGKVFFDSGADNNAAIIWRTAQTANPITERMRLDSVGDLTISNLATGGADEMVTVDTSGKLKKQAIPSGASVGFEMNFLLMGA